MTGLRRSPIRRLRERWLKTCTRWLETAKRRVDGARMARDLHAANAVSALSIPTWTHPEELRALYVLASGLPRGATALEIGAYLGASTCYLAAGLARVDGHLICVDTWGNEAMPEGPRDTFAEFSENVRPVRHLITPVRKRGDQLDASDVPSPLSLAFIDGDHSYEAVKEDVARVLPWLSDSAWLCFHDFGNDAHPGVTRAVGELLASGEWGSVRSVRTLLSMRRQVEKPAPAPGAVATDEDRTG